MIDASHILILAPCHVASAFEFLREVLRPFTPTGSSERDELPRHKIPGMRGNDVEEPSLVRGVAEGLYRADVFVGDFHRARISADSSCWSRTRRRWSASPWRV